MIKFLDWLANLLLIVGGLNWGLVGGFKMNLVEMIFGQGTQLTNITYIVVGVAALWGLFTWIRSMAK